MLSPRCTKDRQTEYILRIMRAYKQSVRPALLGSEIWDHLLVGLLAQLDQISGKKNLWEGKSEERSQ